MQQHASLAFGAHTASVPCLWQAAQEIKQELGPAVAPYFQPSTFLKFERDAVGAISLPVLMQYISLSSVSLRLVGFSGWHSL